MGKFHSHKTSSNFRLRFLRAVAGKFGKLRNNWKCLSKFYCPAAVLLMFYL